MQISDIPIAHILVRANTSSNFNSCDCAIITISEQWKQDQLRRFAVAKSLADDSHFQSISFHDCSVDFYHTTLHCLPDIDELLGEKSWAFVEVSSDEELDEDELSEEEMTNSKLDDYTLMIGSDGKLKYTAYNDDTDDKFWTKEFSLQELLEKL